MTLSPRAWDDNPALIHPDYKSTVLRGPTRQLVPAAAAMGELTQPVYGHQKLREIDADLTANARKDAAPLGERIVVAGKVLGDDGRPVPNALVEIWQANAAGRYVHKVDQHDAPLDPNFLGAGRCLTDTNGTYRFLTVKPGAYPWGNHANAWRPNHIHFSLFGAHFASRLITQMYFPGDPLLALDPIYLGVPEHARDRLVAKFDLDLTQEGFALGYRFDIVLRGGGVTPREDRP